MTASSDEWIVSWERRRKRGVWYFLFQWILGFAVAFILYNALHWFLGDRPFDIVGVLTRALLIGLGVGTFIWIRNQDRYRKHNGAAVSDA